MKSFTAQIVMTTKCNLACKYCYMKNEEGSMDANKIKCIKDNMFNIMVKYECNSYNVSYFGGEPLLEFDLIHEVDDLFKNDKMCKHRTIISNGLLLTPDKVDFIKKNGIGFSLSFDGLWNDTNRVYAFDNSGTLRQYLLKMDLIREVSPHNCKVMVSPSSVDTLVENYHYLTKELRIENVDYSLVRDPIWSKEDITKFGIECHRLAEEYIKDLESGNRYSIGFFTLALLDTYIGTKLGKRPYSCFAGNSGLGFMPNGLAYPCARFGSIKQFPIYDYMENVWNENNFARLNNEEIYNPILYKDCLECSIRQYCNAGCIYNFINNDNKVIDSVCQLYKIIYAEALEIVNKARYNEILNSIVSGALNRG